MISNDTYLPTWDLTSGKPQTSSARVVNTDVVALAGLSTFKQILHNYYIALCVLILKLTMSS